MKNVLAILLLGTLSYAATGQKVTVPAPKFQAGELVVGNAKFKSGFYAYNEKNNPVAAARVQVDTQANLITIKWFSIQSLPANGFSVRNLLSTRNFKIPLTQVASPVLYFGSEQRTERNPAVKTPWWNFITENKTITKDPYTPTHEEQYRCLNEKNACFRINGNNSSVDMKLSVTSSTDGQTLNFMTDYEYTRPATTLNAPCSYDRQWNGYPECVFSKAEKVKYQSVALNEYDIAQAYAIYRDSLVDVIDRTVADYELVAKSKNTIWSATKSCYYNVTMGVENKLTSRVIESIRGEGIDQRCFAQELSRLRIRFAPEQLTGFIFSEEQIALGKTLNEIESGCPYETWTGPRNSYTIFQKQCIEAGIQRLEMKLDQISSEIKRYTK